MLGLVGLSIFPSEYSNNTLWNECKKDILKKFPVYFIEKKHINYTIEFCFNNSYAYNLNDVSSFFLGANTEKHKFDINDHGLLLTVSDNLIKIENDWLGSIPIFYDKEKKIVSTFYNAVGFHTIQENSNYSDTIGRCLYYKYGYSAFGITPIKNINFLKANSKILINTDAILIENNKDTVLIKNTNTQDVIDAIVKNLELKLKNNDDECIIPLSGGLDSRMLAGLLKGKKPITATYGGSKHNFEPIYAETVAKKLNLKWHYIQLENYYDLMDEWCSVYGLSTHAHGMYQIEFYRKIKKITNRRCIISGIFADIWAGNSKIELSSKDDLIKLGYSHGLALSKDMGIEFNLSKNIEESTFIDIQNSEVAHLDSLHRIRLKIILISYLISTPRLLGFNVVTPFLNKEVAVSMLGLPSDMRESRKWQFNLIKSMDLKIPKVTSMLKASFINGMDASAMLNADFNIIFNTLEKFNNKNTGIRNQKILNLKAVSKLSRIEKFNLYASSTRGLQRVITKVGLRSKALIHLRDIQCIYPFIYVEKIKCRKQN